MAFSMKDTKSCSLISDNDTSVSCRKTQSTFTGTLSHACVSSVTINVPLSLRLYKISFLYIYISTLLNLLMFIMVCYFVDETFWAVPLVFLMCSQTCS